MGNAERGAKILESVTREDIDSSILDWRSLVENEPPPFAWIIDHWLSFHPTLFAGSGGVGKSLLAQALGSSLALGIDYLGSVPEPKNVLIWSCEDDHDELWRRQVAICRHFGKPLDSLNGRLWIDCRRGLDSVLYAQDHGMLSAQPALKFLRQQVNDWKIDVLFLDNASQVFGGNENDRHHVTRFVNALTGLRSPLCPVILGHISRALGSEFSGSTAWENAVRMRLFLGNKLPDQKPDEEEHSDDTQRFLCKRKTNYTVQDFRRFTYQNGLLIPDALEPHQGNGSSDLYSTLRRKNAETAILEAVKALASKSIWGSGSIGPNFLPSLIIRYGLVGSLTKREVSEAVDRLVMQGMLVRAVVGKLNNRMPRFGLVLSAAC
jgi:AAA domain